VKEPEISQSPPPSPRTSRGPRYRYYSNPPTTVSLRLADLASEIPETARLPGFDAEQSVELSCEEIFDGPAPKLPLSRLAQIACEHVRIDGVPDNPIRLPVAKLALAYRFVNGRELLEEEPPPDAAKSELERSPEEFGPKAEKAKAEECRDTSGEPKEASVSASGEAATGEVKAVDAPPVTAPADSLSETSSAPPPVGAKSLPEDAKASEPISLSQETASKQDSPPAADSGSPATGEPGSPEPEVWRPITVFPIFRRKVVEPQVKPPVAPIRPVLEVRVPRAPFVPPEFSAKPAQEEPAKSESAGTPAKEPAPPTPPPEAVLLETEHLPKSEPRRAVEIVDQDALQAVFMTEEILSVDRVVELCGGLPGIRSCVLAHGAAVLAAHNVPESIDLVSLSAHALEMLAAMRQSAARMGVGAVPAVTIHAEKGPITFFHQDDLCLLVMHKDRGFIPGVREKLQKVVEYLSRANPTLAVEGSRLAWVPRKPSS
jgi:predicted regulator of Ras-like GTPase activity (Roadblock/LC7/MglB family)